MNYRHDLRNIAIIAHVDHGKTTLVDAMFQQSGVFREGQQVAERVMDSIDLERERGITIMAKSTSVTFGDVTLQLVDTPGHADFGGEVERTLRMVDGVLLLVDAAEGPLPQTRFVLRKSLELGLPAVIAINKIDRADARATEVLDEVYDLFINLGAGEKQIEFPVLFTEARAGTATTDLAKPGTDLKPLVDAIVATVPPPEERHDEPFLMQVNSLGHDDYVGRLVVGRVLAGRVRVNDPIHCHGDSYSYAARVTGVYRFHGVQRIDLEEAKSGDIIALAGFHQVGIGDTLSPRDQVPERLPALHIDEPTVAMVFQVNDGPLAGRSGGKFVTSRHLRQRLEREAYANVSVHVEVGETADQMRVLGRGELQLSILIETMRREGYELCVRNPQVVIREDEAGKHEPTERLVVDVAIEHMGAVTELLGPRKARMVNQHQDDQRVRLEFIVPTRGLLGLRGVLLTATRGTAMVHSVFEGWIPWTGPIAQRSSGAIVADRQGGATPYALFHLQPRGIMFITPGTMLYEGMIIGEHNRENDVNVHASRPKKQTNVRAAGKDERAVVSPPRKLSLEQCLDWIRDDEMVEITPEAIRMRKAVLACGQRSVVNPMNVVG